jgi:hypothetical protein
MRAHSADARHMTLRQRCVLWLLAAGERWVTPLFPRGELRQGFRARIDRAQARLHSRVHDHDGQR